MTVLCLSAHSALPTVHAMLLRFDGGSVDPQFLDRELEKHHTIVTACLRHSLLQAGLELASAEPLRVLKALPAVGDLDAIREIERIKMTPVVETPSVLLFLELVVLKSTKMPRGTIGFLEPASESTSEVAKEIGLESLR